MVAVPDNRHCYTTASGLCLSIQQKAGASKFKAIISKPAKPVNDHR
jgi:hypothetical protein